MGAGAIFQVVFSIASWMTKNNNNTAVDGEKDIVKYIYDCRICSRNGNNVCNVVAGIIVLSLDRCYDQIMDIVVKYYNSR